MLCLAAASNAYFLTVLSLLMHQNPVFLPAPGTLSAVVWDSNSSTIFLQWEAPDQPHGKIIEYEVRWKAQWADCGRACEADSGWTIAKVNDREWHREDLCPYRPYELIVSACTIKGCGDQTVVNASTKEDGR